MKHETVQGLIDQYSTPLYVFDIETLKERVGYLQAHLPKSVELCYAVKANTFLIKEINDCIQRFEVCSPGEKYICDRLGIPAEKIVISGVYKTPEFIESLFASGQNIGYYTIESREHLHLLDALSQKYNKKCRVLIRLTSGNQFGVEEAVVREMVSTYADRFEIAGIQYFSGTQKHSMKRLKRELDALDGLMQSLEADYGFITKELEFGPGLQVCYFEGEAYDEDAFLKEFSQLLEGMQYKTNITLELGRAIAASCGTYLTRVVDQKVNQKQNYAIVDGGIHQLVYYGQSMAMKHPQIELYPIRQEEARENWNIFGSLCTVNDILVKQLPAADLKIGDVLAFQKAGAYCMTEGISLFLSRELPQVVILKENGESVLVRNQIATDEVNTPHYERKESL